MSKNTITKHSPNLVAIFSAFCLMLVLILQAPQSSFAEESQNAPKQTKSEVEKVLDNISNPDTKINEPKLFDIYAATTERALGNPKAPITVIEYASMTCPHCSAFHSETFSEVKEQYIDTDKVYWIFREFPLDKLALRASMMARCVAPSMYFNIVEVLFTSQTRWLGSDDPLKALEQTGRLAGMSPELFKECTSNTDLEMHVLKNMQTGQTQWSVKSTPTFVVNYGEAELSGARKIHEFQEIFDKLLQKQGL